MRHGLLSNLYNLLPGVHTRRITKRRTSMSLETFIRAMPKVELHVHLEGAIQPATLLELARRNNVTLPATGLEDLRAWYTFTGFPHFAEIYATASSCLLGPEDIELIAREFLAGQAAQNIRYSEVTYTAYTHYKYRGMSFEDQLAALNRARAWAEAELNTSMGLIIDIPREFPMAEDEPMMMAGWVRRGLGRGVVALGLAGLEAGHPPGKFKEAFAYAREGGAPAVVHAGETAGAESIWGALLDLHAVRIGHGVRCLEDPELVAELRARQTPLEVCPTSNVCLGVTPSLAEHPLPRLLAEGLYVTLNSDDPPMFNTTLTGEYQAVAQTFGLGADALEQLVLNAVRASLLPAAARASLEARFRSELTRLRVEHSV
jgi:adenosine deaminase